MEVLEFLLSQEGICKDVQDNEGWTPFHAAVCWGQTDTMKFLAEKGANMDVRNLHGETAYGKLATTFLFPSTIGFSVTHEQCFLCALKSS